MNHSFQTKTRFDSLTSELCAEIDEWREAYEAAILERDEYKRKYSELLDSSLRDCSQTTGALLEFALAEALKLP